MISASRSSLTVRLAFILACLGVTWASGSLVDRAATQQSDISTFYRTAQAIRGGVTAEFYGQPDERGGRRCIPPAGTMFFGYMPWLSAAGAAAVWLVFNLGLLVLGAWALGRVFGRLERHRRLYRRIWPWAVMLLMVLSVDALQVGQFSLLFTTCWLLYLALDSGFAAAAMLMLPAAIKIYPALLWAVPLARRQGRQLLWLAPAALLIGVLLPLSLYGTHLPDMWRGFFRHTIVRSADSRLGDMFSPKEEANQSLDNQLFRALTDQPEFNEKYPHFPHLHLPPEGVAKLAAALKLGLLLATALAAWRLGSRSRAQPRWTALLMLGLWSVTLVLLLPENKAPYIVYCFPGWLPVLAMLAARSRHRRLPWHCAAVVALGLASLIQTMPHAVRCYGPALVATVALWAILLRAAWQARLPATGTHHEGRGRGPDRPDGLGRVREDVE